MATTSSDHGRAHTAPAAWVHDNERGLALAADGDWAEASEAFAAAADGLARTLPSDPRGAHEPLALVLSNLAQAYYRLHRLDDALLQAQRVCALRVAITGEDGMPVARARMDLAVMLATAGRVEEANALVQRAIAVIEHRVGEEDARLAIVLENAARIALASGAPANAEPLLLRLHALLDAHELSTARAEELLARVAAARQHAVAAAEAPEISAAPAQPPLPAFEDDLSSRVYAHATIAELEDWDDQPLRDAVAVTDVLLRTTPSGVPVIPPAAASSAAPAASDALEALDIVDLAPVTPANIGEIALDLTDEGETAPTAKPTASPTAAPGGEPLIPTSTSGLLLDFDVAHGVVDEDVPVIEAPPVSRPVPEALEVAPEPAPALVIAPTPIVSSGPTTGIAPMEGIVETAPLPPAQRPNRRTTEERVVMPKSAPPKGKTGPVAAIGGALVLAAAAAAYFLLR